MLAKFDSFSRIEVPKIFICPPGTTISEDGKLSAVIGIIHMSSDEEMVLNFNQLSSFNFRLYKSDGDALFDKVKNKIMLYLDGIGFFVVTDVSTESDGMTVVKDITASSCECEIQNRNVPYIEDGTYQFFDIMSTLVSNIPLWTLANIDSSIANKYRTFEDVSETENILSFMLKDIQDAYECIIEFDITKRLIYVYDQNNYVNGTNIHLTHDNLIESIEISEDSNDVYTAITALGNDDIVISPVNPLGTNTIYDFSYYKEWMSSGLRDAISDWEDLYEESRQDYYDYNLEYYTLLEQRTNTESDISRCDIQLDIYRRCRDNIVAESGFNSDIAFMVDASNYSQLIASVNSYNAAIESSGGTPISINKSFIDPLTIYSDEVITTKTPYGQAGKEVTAVYIKDQEGRYIKELTQSDTTGENTFTYNSSTHTITFNSGDYEDGTNVAAVYSIADSSEPGLVILIAELLREIDTKITDVESTRLGDMNDLSRIDGDISDVKTNINSIITSLNLRTATGEYYEELLNYIFEGSYTDEYVVITDSMSYSDKFEQMKTLFDRAELTLSKAAKPTQEFSLDVENFVFEKSFLKWSEQLKTGCAINVEIEDGDVAELFLSSFTVNYSDKSLSMTFGNRLNRYDMKSLFEDTLGKISKSANTISFIKDTLYPVKDGELNRIKESLAVSRNITAGNAFAAKNNSITIDESGYTGRSINEAGEIDDEQIKIVNNSITFTDDAWDTCRTAIGKLQAPDGSTKYGINAEVLIGELIIGNELQLYDDDGNDFVHIIDSRIEYGLNTEYGTWLTIDPIDGVKIGRQESSVYSQQDNESYKFKVRGTDDILLEINTYGISLPSLTASAQIAFSNDDGKKEWVIRHGAMITVSGGGVVGHNLNDYWIGG